MRAGPGRPEAVPVGASGWGFRHAGSARRGLGYGLKRSLGGLWLCPGG
jgi:hypothetical protein